MNIEAFLQAHMDKRAEQGLKLVFVIPGRPDPWTCYPKDDASRRKWLAKGAREGWKLKAR